MTQDVTYTYKVLKSNVIDAFSAPGGPVMITEMLARTLTTDDELIKQVRQKGLK